MTSPARAHRLRIAAEAGQAAMLQLEAAPAQPPAAPTGTLEQYQAAIAAAISNYKAATVAMSPERTAAKRAALADILPFVQGYIDAGHSYPNSVAVQAMIWLFDVGDIERALSLGLALIVQGCHHMPRDDFKRPDLETFVCDAVYDWANVQLKAGQPAAPYLEQLILALEAGKWALSLPVHSKMYAMAAKHAKLAGDWSAVLKHCIVAQNVNPDGAGVKTLKDEALAKLAASRTAAP